MRCVQIWARVARESLNINKEQFEELWVQFGYPTFVTPKDRDVEWLQVPPPPPRVRPCPRRRRRNVCAALSLLRVLSR